MALRVGLGRCSASRRALRLIGNLQLAQKLVAVVLRSIALLRAIVEVLSTQERGELSPNRRVDGICCFVHNLKIAIKARAIIKRVIIQLYTEWYVIESVHKAEQKKSARTLQAHGNGASFTPGNKSRRVPQSPLCVAIVLRANAHPHREKC